MRTNIAYIAIAALAVFGTGCVDRAKQSQAKRTEQLISDPTKPVVVQPVEYRTLTETLEITGELTTSQEASVGAKRSGRLTAVFVNDGDVVTPGQLIASIEATDQSAQLRQAMAQLSSAQSQLSQARVNAAVTPSKSSAALSQAEAQLRSAKAQLQKALAGARTQERSQAEWQVRAAKSALDTAEKELERTQTLVNEGAIARSRLDQAQNAYNSALTQYNSALQQQSLVVEGARPEDIEIAREAVRQAEEAVRQAKAQKALDVVADEQVQAARAAVQSAQAQVDLAKQAVADTQVRAPFGGRVAGKSVQPGTIVSPGEPIVRLVGSSGLYFEGNIPESAVSQVQAGKPVAVTVSAVAGRVLQGTVVAVSPESTGVGRQFRARIRLDGDLQSVKPGMFATGVVTLRAIPGALVVPSDSVVQRGGKDVVFIVNGDKAKQVEVTTQHRQGQWLQVGGVQPGWLVVTQGQTDLADGLTVKIEEQKRLASAESAPVGG